MYKWKLNYGRYNGIVMKRVKCDNLMQRMQINHWRDIARHAHNVLL